MDETRREHVGGHADHHADPERGLLGEWIPEQAITVQEALEAFHVLTRMEGIIPALESSHAIAYAQKLAAIIGTDGIMIVNLSGRGDKDIQTIAKIEGVEI